MIYRPGFSVMNQLVERASDVTGIPTAIIRHGSREKVNAHVRFAIMDLARKRGLSFHQIARSLGGMHHTSVMHGVGRAQSLKDDGDFSQLVREIDG